MNVIKYTPVYFRLANYELQPVMNVGFPKWKWIQIRIQISLQIRQISYLQKKVSEPVRFKLKLDHIPNKYRHW